MPHVALSILGVSGLMDDRHPKYTVDKGLGKTEHVLNFGYFCGFLEIKTQQQNISARIKEQGEKK